MNDPLIVALDVGSEGAASELVSSLGDEANFYKVGMELYACAGMAFVRSLLDQRKRVFLDLKFYDIGETVKRAVAQVAKSGVTFLTVHAVGQVMRAAVEGRGGADLKILGVTVLTSFDQQDLADDGHTGAVSELVHRRAAQAMQAGIDGLIASPLEAKSIREQIGAAPILVTPGVRSRDSDRGDQKRVATPAEALRDGANYLVIGRQVTRAKNPRRALADIRTEIGAWNT